MGSGVKGAKELRGSGVEGLRDRGAEGLRRAEHERLRSAEIQGLGFKVPETWFRLDPRASSSAWFWVQGVGFGFWGVWFRVQGLGFRVWGSGLEVLF
mmetsp:Transcript_31872/g.49826  ORF Transcript_31872/g.49826 Transcript_31872/m.49826 type:complete len:97 (+) Transcript_31872:68-358(+)